jgi:murein DD-endopeptidase MepM/ murein hydrolase activator NlpD
MMRRQLTFLFIACLGLAGCTAFDEATNDHPVRAPGFQSGYEIAAGPDDTVASVAQRFNIPNQALIQANHLRPPYQIEPHQLLIIPPPATYRVRDGDTVAGIAASLGVDEVALASANGLRQPYHMHVNQALKVPGGYGSDGEIAGEPPTEYAEPILPPRASISAQPLAPPPSAQPVSPPPAPPPSSSPPVQSVPPSRALPAAPPASVRVVAPTGNATATALAPPPTTLQPPRTAFVPQPPVAQPAAPAPTPRAAVIPSRPVATQPTAILPTAPPMQPPTTKALPPPPVTAARSTPTPAPAAGPAMANPAPGQQAALGGPHFIKPVGGAVTQGFGPDGSGQTNDGINIVAPAGTSVKAADAGTVIYTGNELAAFGNLILIRHAGGWVTAYGHLASIGVQRGTVVTQGQAIGTVGQTGAASAPQLHFEIRQGSKPVDPAPLLSGGRS